MIETTLHESHREIRLDCGPRNVLGLETIEALRDAISPMPEQPVVVLRGRTDGFSAGLDGRVLASGGRKADRLLAGMGRLLADALAGPTRIVAVCQGHAVAAGAMLLLVADVRLGLPGRYKVGFTEPGLGMPLPELPARLARERLDPRRLHRLTVLGEVVGPERAAEAGFLDAVVPPETIDERVAEEVAALGALSEAAYVGSHRAVHGELIQRVEALASAAEARAAR